MLFCEFFLKAVFTCDQGSRGKGQCRCRSCHLHWPENSKEKINFNIYQKYKKKNTQLSVLSNKYTVENYHNNLCITNITVYQSQHPSHLLIINIIMISIITNSIIFSWVAPTRLRSRRTAASAGWLKRNLCTPPKVITVPGDKRDTFFITSCAYPVALCWCKLRTVGVCAAVYEWGRVCASVCQYFLSLGRISVHLLCVRAYIIEH